MHKQWELVKKEVVNIGGVPMWENHYRHKKTGEIKVTHSIYVMEK